MWLRGLSIGAPVVAAADCGQMIARQPDSITSRPAVSRVLWWWRRYVCTLLGDIRVAIPPWRVVPRGHGFSSREIGLAGEQPVHDEREDCCFDCEQNRFEILIHLVSRGQRKATMTASPVRPSPIRVGHGWQGEENADGRD